MVPRTWQTIAFLFLFLLGQPAKPVVNAASVPAVSGTCQQAYGASLEVSDIPSWLQVENSGEPLETSFRLDLLAGKLLQTGIVDGSVCPSYGLFPDGSPNGCGMEVSQSAVTAWQNRFDGFITQHSVLRQVPARVMKALVAVESQFWPGAVWQKGEVGLGQMTEFGADLVLSWQVDRYQQICSLVFDTSTCAKPYRDLEPWQQAALWGYVLKSIDPTCATCPGGINLSKGEQQIVVLSESLVAGCQQTSFAFRRATGNPPSSSVSYEDFWKTVLASYHAGSGCVFSALQKAGNPDSWEEIAAHFPQGCGNGAEYIRRIEQYVAP